MSSAYPVQRLFSGLSPDSPLLLSGGLGTELQRRGVPTPVPLWATAALRADPQAVRSLHADYVRAGAGLVTANTFRTDRRTLGRRGLADEARELTKLAVRLAREGAAAARPAAPVLVAGSIGPLADCYRPEEVPDDLTLRTEHALRVGDHVAAGVDLVLIETMNSVREAAAALGAARAGAVPAMVSFVCGPEARLLSGEPLAEAVAAVRAQTPLAVLVNCCAPRHATTALAALLASTDLPTGVYANGRGRPDEDQGWRFDGGARDRAYLRHARRWLDMGAAILGGCCGTTPRTISRLARLLRARERRSHR